MNRSSWIKIAVFAVLAAAGCWLLFGTPFGTMLLSAAGRSELVERMNGMVRDAGAFGPLAFVAIMTAGLLFLPATPFVLAGALLFGKLSGSLYNFTAAILAASASFVLGRYFLHDLAHRFASGKLAELNAKSERHGFSVIFYLRLAWFPFIVLNYGAGATRIRFKDYFWGTVLGGAAPFIISTFCFGSFWELARSYRSPADLLHFDVLFPVALLVFSLFLPKIARTLRGATRADDDA